MDVLSGVRDNWFKLAASTLLVLAATCSGSAEDKLTGGPTPSPPGAAAYFLELKDGDTVPTKVTVRFGLREMGVAPADSDRPNSGHHHLLIDTDLPPLNEPIPNDFNHLHFGAGQTETQVTLKPGPHTLQLLLGDKDHIPHSPPVMSPRIRVIASDATTSPQVAAEDKLTGGPTPSPPGAAAYFLELRDGDTVRTKVTVRFGLREMGVAPAGSDRPNSGHHHLLIDADLPPLNEPIPNDFNHLHFGAGQTEAQVILKPGPHTLQLLLGDKDHIPHSPPVMSPRIRVIASDATTVSPQVAAASVKKRRHAQARSRNYYSSAAYRKYSRSPSAYRP